MRSHSFIAVSLCAALGACTSSATAPPGSPTASSAVPDTAANKEATASRVHASCSSQPLPAGVPAQRLRALMTALASDAPAVQREYIENNLAARVRRTVPMARQIAELDGLRAKIGGAEMCRVEYHTPYEIGVFTARQHPSVAPVTGTAASAAAGVEIKRLVLELEDEAPHGVFFTRVMDASLDDVEKPLKPLDAAARKVIIDSLAGKLDGYIFADVAEAMKRELRSRAAAGAYAEVVHPKALASWLSADLRRVSKDKHLRVRYGYKPLPADLEERREPTAAEIERQRKRAAEKSYGFAAVDIRDGNIGYIDLRGFFPPEIAAEAADDAMSKIADTRALIFDLRRNGGGSPGLIAHITSYLFGATPVHLNDLYFRVDSKREEFWTKKDVPGKRFGPDKPIYVLTSGYTFSGGEEFAYNLQTQKRATLIGETTGGGAHPVRGYRVTDHILLILPVGRAINAVTGDNWEGKGVRPDIEIPADQALDKALALIAGKG